MGNIHQNLSLRCSKGHKPQSIDPDVSLTAPLTINFYWYCNECNCTVHVAYSLIALERICPADVPTAQDRAFLKDFHIKF